MAELWPLTLPQFVQIDGFESTEQDTNIISNNDVGPKKIRRRFTEPGETIKHVMWMSKEQVLIFRNYHKVTLQNGSLTFLFTHPMIGLQAEWRFVSKPSYKGLGGLNFEVMMEWYMMPGTLGV